MKDLTESGLEFTNDGSYVAVINIVMCQYRNFRLDQGWANFLIRGPEVKKKYCRGPNN
jgi:hypothetical protein